MKYIQFYVHTIIAVSLIAITGCNKPQDLSSRGVKGSITSTIKHKNLDGTPLEMSPINAFSEVVNDGSMKVIVVPDNQFSVGVAASATDEQLVQTTVTNNVLHVSYSNENSVDNENNIIYVHSPAVTDISLAKKGDVEAAGTFTSLSLDVTGKGTATLSGTTGTLAITSSGTGEVDASGMPAINVLVTGKPKGGITVAPTTTLTVDIKGGIVYYSGDPIINATLKDGAQLIRE